MGQKIKTELELNMENDELEKKLEFELDMEDDAIRFERRLQEMEVAQEKRKESDICMKKNSRKLSNR